MKQPTVAEIYRALGTSMPYHAGAMASARTHAIPATSIIDSAWINADLDTASEMYGRVSTRVLGTIRWYSLSSVLVAPTVESLAVTGIALNPALSAITIDAHEDGRFAGARSSTVLGGDISNVGSALCAMLETIVTAIGPIIGSPTRALLAIATDSIANRLLWAGNALDETKRCTELAERLAIGFSSRLPTPQYSDIGAHRVVRRTSCCLIYEVPNCQKCTSCPRQLPAERDKRIRDLLG